MPANPDKYFAEQPQTSPKVSKRSPLFVIDLLKAIKAEKTKATIQGSSYTLRYEKDGRVWYRKDGAFAPCGWTRKERLEHELAANG